MFDPAKSVFINCPFDPAYAPLFEAIVFAAVCCGFVPRSALESGNVAEPRLERITRAIFGSKYSIHDLSRCTGEGSENLARFNMPLELGMAMASRFMKPEFGHDWLVLVPEGHRYERFISDLAGYDPAVHNESAESVFFKVTAWLATRPGVSVPATPLEMVSALPAFSEARQELERQWGGAAPWPELVLAATRIARESS